MKRHLTIAGLAFLLTCLSLPGPAAGDRLSLREMGFERMEAYEEEDFSMRNEIEIGMLFPGESYYFEMHMSAGVEYVVAAGGSPEVEALKLEMFDENFRMVTADVTLSPEVAVTYLPEWSGTYFFRLTMVECPDAGAHWYLIKGYK